MFKDLNIVIGITGGIAAYKACGIVSFFIGWFALGITAIVLACMSKDETNGVMCSSAKVGYVCGIISTALTFVFFVVIVAVITSLSL